MIMTLELVPFDSNMRPSVSRLAWMVLNNLLSDELPMLLLENCCAVTLNALLHKFY